MLFRPPFRRMGGGESEGFTLHQDFLRATTLAEAVIAGSVVSFARASLGTYFDSAGVLRAAGNDAARFDHKPATGAPLGLLIEEARTNLALHSEDFANAVWGQPVTLLSEVDANTDVAPDGTTTMDKLRDINLASVTSFRQEITVANDSLFHTFSLFILKDNDETRFPRIQLGYQLGTLRAEAYWINTKTGATLLQGGVGTVTAEDHGLYWRMICTLDNNTTGNTKLVLVVEPAAGIFFGTFKSTATGEVTVWGAQLEKSSFPTSYIKTTAAAVTRSADLVSMSDVSWFNAAEGTFFVEANDGGTPPGAFARLTELNDGADSDRLIMMMDNGKPRIFVGDDGITQAALAATDAIVSGVTFKVAGAYKLDDIAITSQGAVVNTDSKATMPDETNFNFTIGTDRAAAIAFWNGHIARITYWPRRLPNGVLQSLTA